MHREQVVIAVATLCSSFKAWLVFASLLISITCTSAQLAAQDESEQPNVQPGLIGVYRSINDSTAVLHRIDAKPAFYLADGSIHPRLPEGAFRVTWTGVINWRETAPVSFSAVLQGNLTIRIDGETVLEGSGGEVDAQVRATQPFQREPAIYSIEIAYQSPDHPPAQLQIWWESPDFSPEPLAAWHLHHAPDEQSANVLEEQQLERGRMLVGQYGCAKCHPSSLPAVDDPPPGPVLANLNQRIGREWLMAWLADPKAIRADTHMPALFASDRLGQVERWAISEHLRAGQDDDVPRQDAATGDHRMGRRRFISLGCAACHFLPESAASEQEQAGQRPFVGLSDRWTLPALAQFLTNVHARYPDHRMPQFPIDETAAQEIASYLLLWSAPSSSLPAMPAAPTAKETSELLQRTNSASLSDAGSALLHTKGCVACHPGSMAQPRDLPIRMQRVSAGCLSHEEQHAPHFTFTADEHHAIIAYLKLAPREIHSSPFAELQGHLQRSQCTRCHQRDSDRLPPIEQIGSTLGGAWLQRIPYQRTPRLTFANQKFEWGHLVNTVREGLTGVRDSEFTYRMPSFGADAERLITALAAADGDSPASQQSISARPADPTLGSLAGPELVGFQGYSCVGCHAWKGELLASPDPAAMAPDLLRTVGRIRRPWFDRMLENPLRLHPGIPMPAVFPKGRPVLLDAVLNGDAQRQRDALWAYFSMGEQAPSPKPAPGMMIAAPRPGQPPLVAQIPLHLDTGPIESLSLLYDSHDLVVIDLQKAAVVAIYSGAEIERTVTGRIRRFRPASQDSPIATSSEESDAFWMFVDQRDRSLHAVDRHEFLGYELRGDEILLRRAMHYDSATIRAVDTLKLVGRTWIWDSKLDGVPDDWRPVQEKGGRYGVAAPAAGPSSFPARHYFLPSPQAPAPAVRAAVLDAGRPAGSLERPGYRATEFPIPQSPAGEDLVMPSAIAVPPREKRVLVASMKLGELFELSDPLGDGSTSEFRDYARGLFQEAYSMTADNDALYVLHRRNLTKIMDTDDDGVADQFERVAALPHGVADQYDYAYGLARDASGAFVFSYAPYASRHLPGSGGALRLDPKTQSTEEIAFGMRNPLGWCAGPNQEIFFTDNQGEWVATNKLCHVMRGHFYGFPNTDQPARPNAPRGRTAVWVPYAWAHSINGVTYDSTGGKFGPFAGQFFMAELMFGGAIIRANVELVNGQYQGACFPFWGNGLLGPVTLAFHPDGPLFVGSITEPGWMAQPDRGGLYRIDYTGELPFEMQSIHVLPQGFRIRFTRPVDHPTASNPSSYSIESYRYEYTGAYGSPELDRAASDVQRAIVAVDGMSVDLLTSPLVIDRVYMISGTGVKSEKGEPLYQPTGAYTLNELPHESETK